MYLFFRQTLSLNYLGKKSWWILLKTLEKPSEFELKFDLTRFVKVLRIRGPLGFLLFMKGPSIMLTQPRLPKGALSWRIFNSSIM